MTHPWLAPDARAFDDTLPAAPLESVDDAVAADVPTPVPLRPMTVADILDGGIAVLKAAPRSVLVIAATFVLPYELVAAWVQRDTLADRGLAGAFTAATSNSDSNNVNFTIASFVLIAVAGVVLSLVTGAIAHLLSAWFADRPASALDGLRASLRRAPALAGAWVIVHLVEYPAAVAGLVPGVLFMAMFLVTAPAIVIEGLGPWAGIRRSWRLVRTRYGAVLGAGVLIAIVSFALSIALSGLSLAFSFFSWGWIIDVICRGASSLVTVPFVAAATTLVYLDLRIRAEGLDLELDIAEHFHRGA